MEMPSGNLTVGASPELFDFAKTQKEADCKEYKTSTAWYYEECRKRNISIEFHWNDNAGKEVCKHVCSN